MRLLRALGLIAFLAAAAGIDAGAAQAASLSGKVLVASEGMPDPRFQETVIYMIDHDENGAFGLVVNKPSAVGPIGTLLDELGIDAEEYGFDVPGSVTLHYGGPVDPGRGFVLHSAEYEVDGTQHVSNGIALTISPEALIDIALGQGPRRSLIIFGYSGWGPAQLEGELARGDWTVTDADPDLVLGTDHESKWRRSLRGIII